MARRASSRVSPATLVLALVFILGAIAAGSYFLVGQSNPFRALPPLDVASYLENANSLRGNVYRVDGTVQNSLAFSSARGRLVSIQTGEGSRADYLAILVPVEFNHINLQKGQRYQFKVEIGKDGVIEAKDLRKS
jgi:hypothetical protein